MPSASASPSLPVPSQPAVDIGRNGLRDNLRVVQTVLVFYLVDAVQFGGFAALGVVPWRAAFLYAAFGLLLCGSGLALLQRNRGGRAGAAVVNRFLTLASSAGLLLTAWALPPVGVLVLMSLLVVVSAGAMDMRNRHVAPLLAVMSAGVLAAISFADAPLAMPVQTGLQRAATTVWFALVLAKVALINLINGAFRANAQKLSRQLQEALAQVEKLARIDSLTGLLNRGTVLALAEEEALRARRAGLPFSLALIDIDRFKLINDTHGHAAGDAVLKRAAELLAGAVRAVDRVARYGGEEFLVLMPSPCDGPAALAAMERLRETLAACPWPQWGDMTVTASIGVATVRGPEAIDAAIRRADNSLYEAKRAGRNRVRAA